jgi:hypothetical protein
MRESSANRFEICSPFAIAALPLGQGEDKTVLRARVGHGGYELNLRQSPRKHATSLPPLGRSTVRHSACPTSLPEIQWPWPMGIVFRSTVSHTLRCSRCCVNNVADCCRWPHRVAGRGLPPSANSHSRPATVIRRSHQRRRPFPGFKGRTQRPHPLFSVSHCDWKAHANQVRLAAQNLRCRSNLLNFQLVIASYSRAKRVWIFDNSARRLSAS